MSKEQFDFSKPENQKQFEALPKQAKEILIEHAHEEAKEIQEEIDRKKRREKYSGEEMMPEQKKMGKEGEKEENQYKLALDKLCEKLGLSPEKIKTYDIRIGAKTKDQLTKEMKEKHIYIDTWAQALLDSEDFVTAKNPKTLKLVRISLKDLGFSTIANTEQIYKKAQELDLELCPPEVGPNLRLQTESKMSIGMYPIASLGREPHVLKLDYFISKDRDEKNKPILITTQVGPYDDAGRRLDDEWVFCLRPEGTAF